MTSIYSIINKNWIDNIDEFSNNYNEFKELFQNNKKKVKVYIKCLERNQTFNVCRLNNKDETATIYPNRFWGLLLSDFYRSLCRYSFVAREI